MLSLTRSSTAFLIVMRLVGGLLFPTAAAAQAQQAEWTVLIYMNADNNLEPDAFPNFKQMAAIGSTEAVNILVQFDRIAKYKHTMPDWSQTLRFRVTQGIEPLPAYAVQDLGETNMGAGQTLADFVSWGRQQYPARRYMLVIWDHGQGWRFLAESLLARQRQLLKGRSVDVTDALGSLRAFDSVLRSTAFRSAPGDAYRSASNDETDNDVLYNREMADALKTVLAGGRLDVIGFDACLMSMAESAYAFRDVANVLIGSEELEPGPGWRYDTWLGPLVATPTQTGRQLAAVVVDSYKQRYSGLGGDSETTLSAIDIAKVPTLASAISGLSQTLINRIDSELQPIISARAAVSTYAPGYQFHHVDLKQVALELSRRSSATDVISASQQVAAAVDDAVIANYAGADRQGPYGSNGIAIYFPSSESLHLRDPYAEGGYERGNPLFPVEFVEKEKWTDFLHAFWARVP